MNSLKANSKLNSVPPPKKRQFNVQTIIFGLLLGIAIVFSFSLFSTSCLLTKTWCGQDMDQYKDYSDSLLTGHGFSARAVTNMYFIDPSKNVYVPEILRLPAYPYILTFGRLFLNTPLLVLVINFLSYICIIAYTYFLSRKLMNDTYALFCTICVLFSAPIIFYTTQMGDVDVFVTAAVVGFLYHFVACKKEVRPYHILLAILWGVIAIFSRQNTMIIIFLFGLLGTWQIRMEKHRNRLAGILLIFVLLLMCWMIRNYRITGRPIISALNGEQLFSEHIYFSPYQSPDTGKLLTIYSNAHNQQYIANAQYKGESIPRAYTDLNAILQHQATTFILSHPRATLKQFKDEVYNIFLVPTYSWTKNDIFSFINKFSYLLNALYLISLCVFIILLLSLRNKISFDMFSLWLATGCFAFLSAFAHGIVIGSRGILPVIPLLSVLMVYEIVSITGRTRFFARQKSKQNRRHEQKNKNKYNHRHL